LPSRERWIAGGTALAAALLAAYAGPSAASLRGLAGVGAFLALAIVALVPAAPAWAGVALAALACGLADAPLPWSGALAALALVSCLHLGERAPRPHVAALLAALVIVLALLAAQALSRLADALAPAALAALSLALVGAGLLVAHLRGTLPEATP